MPITLLLAAAILTLAALAMLAWPLLRPRRSGGSDDAAAIYARQLDELDREAALGLIDGAAREAARAEIGRRLLRAGAAGGTGRLDTGASPVAAGLVTLCAGAGAIALYALLGSPQLADQPHAAREEVAAHQEYEDLIAQLERRLAETGGDAEGFRLLAEGYMRLLRFRDAARAFAKAAEKTPEGDPGRPALLGAWAEALTQAADGQVTQEARMLFSAVRAAAPNDLRARYYLAVAEVQASRFAEGIAELQAMRADLGPGHPLLALIDARIEAARVAQAQAASAGASAEDREAMIRGMVAGLAARLAETPDDLAGWTRLIRSYGVLGEAQKRADAIAAARAAFADNPSALAEIDAAAAEP